MRSATHSACGAAAIAALLWSLLLPASGHAHPEAALSPEFPESECIMRVDLGETAELPLPYIVQADDTVFTEGDIVMPDAKTHQFFAFRGSVAPHLLGSQLFPFGEESGETRVLPEWITQDDVDRSAAAAGASDATGFIASMVEATNVLEERSDLDPFWMRITPDAARVPILVERGFVGFSWDLAAVTPGTYQIAGYVFSPPYNAWAVRPGVIKVVDGDADFPALTVDAVDGMIFKGQGRRVHGCIDAPEGTQLQAHFRTEDQGNQPWQRFAEDIEIVDGRFELCFLGPDPALSSVIRVRIEATAPDGTRAFAHTPDALVYVATEARCTPGANVCCPEPAQDAGPSDPGMNMEPVNPQMPGADASVGPTSPVADAATPETEDTDPEATPPSEPAGPAEGSSGGCRVTAGGAERFPAWLIAAAALLSPVIARRRRRFT